MCDDYLVTRKYLKLALEFDKEPLEHQYHSFFRQYAQCSLPYFLGINAIVALTQLHSNLRLNLVWLIISSSSLVRT